MTSWLPTRPPFSSYKKKVFTKALKVSDFIYQIGEDTKLRKPSKEIPLKKIKSREFQAKIRYVKHCLLRYRKLTGYGRGLTAVQVGIPQCFSVIYKGQTVKNIKNKTSVNNRDLMVIINPRIIRKSKVLLKYPEMCMSANPVIVPTIRPSWIEFSYYDENADSMIWDTKDDTDTDLMMNRVFQHELDHMEGTINIDFIKTPEDIILESDPEFYTNAKFEKV